MTRPRREGSGNQQLIDSESHPPPILGVAIADAGNRNPAHGRGSVSRQRRAVMPWTGRLATNAIAAETWRNRVGSGVRQCACGPTVISEGSHELTAADAAPVAGRPAVGATADAALGTFRIISRSAADDAQRTQCGIVTATADGGAIAPGSDGLNRELHRSHFTRIRIDLAAARKRR